MTLDEFKKEVEEELKIFTADWSKAQIRHGKYEFPGDMSSADWWEYFNTYDRNMPFID